MSWHEVWTVAIGVAEGALLWQWGYRAGKKTVPTTVNVTVTGNSPAVEGLRTVVSQAVADDKRRK